MRGLVAAFGVRSCEKIVGMFSFLSFDFSDLAIDLQKLRARVRASESIAPDYAMVEIRCGASRVFVT